MKRKIPDFQSVEEAAAFIEQDLSDLDFSQFKPISFEFTTKAAQINLRVPRPLLDAVKVRARAREMPYTRYIRELIERDVLQPPTKEASQTDRLSMMSRDRSAKHRAADRLR